VLIVHRAERADRLVDALAAVVREPLDDPFAAEVVSVPTRGIERWLSQRLSNTLGATAGRHDGVCANIAFPFPGRLVGAALQSVTGVDPATDPWAVERAVWPLLEVIDATLDEPWMRTLRTHLRSADDYTAPDRRFAAARHLADLYDRYAVHRPEMVTAWASGGDDDESGERLPGDLAWQAILWRRLRARLGVPSPAERFRPALARLRAEPSQIDLPARLTVFGVTRLAPTVLAVLDALATTRDVHLMALHPSPALWDRGGGAARHPLLATWGKDSRELQLALAQLPGPIETIHHPLPTTTTTLLGTIQAGVRADQPTTATADRSIQVHSCHGRARQVEVLRDAILHLLADDPTLEPRDVIVMCPDIEEFAPLVQATFGATDALDVNTWRSGIDRLLVGVAMTEDDRARVGSVLPLDDVGSDDIALAGHLAELVERVRTATSAFTGRRTMRGWAEMIAGAADGLFAAPPLEGWQRTELDRILDDAVDQSAAAPDTTISLAELRALLADRLRGRPSRANFRTGHLTVCTLVPMRSVPHRVVCLLGLDDVAFPRHGAPDGDDIIERAPTIGDPDVRTEDRQLLLDALMAAGDHLIITYSGHDERTNAPLPPAVPIGELLDVVESTAPGGRGVVVIEHPLQPFDGRNFEPGRIVPAGPWSFDAVARHGAEAARRPRRASPSFALARLDPLDRRVIELDDLVRFVEHPTRAFLRQRLGITLGDRDDEIDDAIPIELDGLGKWAVGARLLDARLAGVAWDDALAAEEARGLLAPGVLGTSVLDEVRPVVDAIHAVVRREVGDEPVRSVDANVVLDDATSVRGTVTGLHGSTILTATYSTLAAKQRIAAWVRFLALTAAGSIDGVRAVSVGRGKAGDGSGVARIEPLAADDARDHLGAIVDLYRRGMREPLPIFCKTSEAYARKRAPRAEWETTRGYDREDRERPHVFVFGEGVTYAQLLRQLPDADEDWSDDASRLGRFARRLWDAALAAEVRQGA